MAKHNTVRVTAQVTVPVLVSGPATDAVREAIKAFASEVRAATNVEYYDFDFDPAAFPEAANA